MEERTRKNLITITILLFEIVILFGFLNLLLYLGLTFTWSHYLFATLVISSMVLAPIVWGFTIGFSAYSIDHWKIDIGVVILFTMLNFIPITAIGLVFWGNIGQILYTIFGSGFIFVISYFTKEWRIKRLRSKELKEPVEISPNEESIEDSLN